jgi:cytochrome c553
MKPRLNAPGLLIRLVSSLAAAATLAIQAQVPIPAAELAKLPPPLTRPVDFKTEVYPLFKAACFKCHGPEKQKGKYRMDTKEGAFKVTDDHGPAIAAGKSAQSAIIHMAAGLIDEMLMPPPGGKPGESDPLTREQISLLRGWIDQGAAWPDGPITEIVAPVRFDPEIKALLAGSCAKCHGKVVTPGDPKKSSLLTILAGKDEDIPKPEAHRIADKPLRQVEEWIRQGAR